MDQKKTLRDRGKTFQRMVMVLSVLPRPEVQRSKIGSLETLGEDKQGLCFSFSLPFTQEETESKC